MEFLSLLMALGLLQFWGSGGPLQQDHWFEKLTGYAAQRDIAAALRLSLVIGLPCLALLLLLILIESLLLGLLSLLVYSAVLLFSLGRGEFTELIQRYLLRWNRGELDSAEICLEELTARNAGQVQSDIANTQISLHERLRSALIYGSFQRWFAVVFWFMLLGPVAALAYRLVFRAVSSEGLDSPTRQLAQRINSYFEWLPAKLLSLAFALTGNFVGGFNHSWQSLWQTQSSGQLLETTALAAINDEQTVYPDSSAEMTVFGREQLLALQALIKRSVVCWIVVIALFELFI